MTFSWANWRAVLAPWRRAIHRTLLLDAPWLDNSPARSELENLTIVLSTDRIGRDRARWYVVLEAIELLHVLMELDARLGWTLLLKACGGRDAATLSFPLASLRDVRLLFEVRFFERDLLDDEELVKDLVDAMVFGTPDWNRSIMFRGVKNMMRDVLENEWVAPEDEWRVMDVAVKFVFEDSPPADASARLECLDVIKCFGARIQEYQDPSHARHWDDSVFYVRSFAIDFGDSVLQAAELVRVTHVMLKFSVSSLTFSAWDSEMTPSSLVKDFCRHAVALGISKRGTEVGGLTALTFYAADLPLLDRIHLLNAISSSYTLHAVTFYDSGRTASGGEDWIKMVLEHLFGDEADSTVSSVQLVLSRTTVRGIETAVRMLERKQSGVCNFVEDLLAYGDSPIGVEAALINLFSAPIHHFTAEHHHHDSSTSSSDGEDRATMPEPAPLRLSSHRVECLKIKIGSCVESGGGTTTEEMAALVWLVGDPLRELRLVGRKARDDPASLMTAMQLERVLTACPQLERLELHSLAIESLEPLSDTSLAGHIGALVIKDCQFLNADSVVGFYETLYDSSHQLRDLTMCVGDSSNFKLVNAALDMLAFDQYLDRFVLHGSEQDVATFESMFRPFHDQPVLGFVSECVPIGMKLAFLKVVQSLCKTSDASTLYEAVWTRVFEFAAEPRRRHCVVLGP